jgi:hypothetical protein
MMIRNLKVLGLALVAVFAMSALAASAASAQGVQGEFTTSNGTAQTLIGTETGAAGSGANALTALGAKVECPGSTLTGHKFNVTPHVAIPNKETTATITPHYKNCAAFNPASHPATVTMNGCDYVLHLGVTTGGVAGTYGATVDIVCPAGKVIEVHVYNNVAHTELLCTIKVKGGQNGLAGAHATNTAGTGTFDISGLILGIHVEREGLCLLDGKGSTTANGEFDIDVNVKSSAGVGVSITD